MVEPARAGGDAEDRLMWIDGVERGARSGDWIAVLAPATGELLARTPRGGPADVADAVRAARSAATNWAGTHPARRTAALLAVADAIEARLEELAVLLARETGNALRTQARPEMRTTVDIFRYFAGTPAEMKGVTVPLGPGLLNYTVREPHGVVAAVVPWNSPAILSALKIAMSVATANTIVLKAAEDAPLVVLEIARLCAQVLPPGVVNVLTGYGVECGAPLMAHPGVDKLSFTGSTEVGKSVMRTAAERVLPVSLELGGKSPVIVFPDSDTDGVAAGVIAGMRFTRQGQSCTAGSRLFVHADVFDSFLDRVCAQLAALVVGDPLDETTDIGAMINLRQYDRMRALVEDGIGNGAHVATGAVPLPRTGPGELYLSPMVLTGVHPAWRVAREEVFGPVLVALPWQDEQEAIRLANDTHYGLAAYVWSRDVSAALRTAHAIDAGWVQVNRGLGQLPGMSYGGFKHSGLGAEFSVEGALEGFTRSKTVTVGI